MVFMQSAEDIAKPSSGCCRTQRRARCLQGMSLELPYSILTHSRRLTTSVTDVNMLILLCLAPDYGASPSVINRRC